MNSHNEWLAVLSGFGSKSMDKIGFFPFLGIMGISLLASLFIALLPSFRSHVFPDKHDGNVCFFQGKTDISL